MVADGVKFIFQGQLRYGPVCHLGLIVRIYKGGSSQWDPHHAKLIVKSLHFFNSVLHSNEFSTKDRSLNGCLFLKAILQKIRKPVRGCLVLLSPAWSLSHIMRMSRSLPKGSGMSTGIALSTLP